MLLILLAQPRVAPFVQPRAPKITPVWGSKPLLGYFALTGSLQAPLKSGVQLSDRQFAVMQEVANQEMAMLQALFDESQVIVQNPNLDLERKRARIEAMAYNRRVQEIVQSAMDQLALHLGAPAYGRLVHWVERRWPVEQALHGRAFMLAAPRSFEVYATRYDSKGAYYVALPDQCLKLTNGGLHVCDDDGYQVGLRYEVIVRYEKSTGARVGEAGPWNIDDNYWATVGDPTPRRMFGDLPLGMPQAQAAYFNGYNGGVDQYGRKVTAPFGIDLARQVSIDIGLEPGVNDWVTVSYMWTENWGASSTSSSGAPAATLAPLIPLATTTPNPDGSLVHEVQYGQTLWEIATAYGMSLQDLLTINGLTEDAIIIPGDKLLIRPMIPGELVTATPTTTPTRRATRKAALETATPTETRVRAPTSAPIEPTHTPQPTPVVETAKTPLDYLLVGIVGLIVLGAGLMIFGRILNFRR